MILFEHGLYCRIRQLSLMIHSCWNSMFDHCSSCYGTMAPSWHNQGTNTTLSYVCFLSNENPYNCLYTIRFCVGFCWSGEVRGHDVTVAYINVHIRTVYYYVCMFILPYYHIYLQLFTSLHMFLLVQKPLPNSLTFKHLEDAAAVVATGQLPNLLSELNVTLASPDVVLEVGEKNTIEWVWTVGTPSNWWFFRCF